MNRVGVILINCAVALYLFAAGIIGMNYKYGSPTRRGGEIGNMIDTLFPNAGDIGVLTAILSICAIVAAVFLLLELFNIPVPITDIILLVFVIIWAVFIIIVDIVGPLGARNKPDAMEYLSVLASHLVVLGALFISSKRLGGGWAA